MNLSQFISEVETSLSNYVQDIDRISIKMWVIQRLRIFGNNIAELKETVVKVENSKATLPEDFKSLKMALKVKGVGCNTPSKDVTDTYIYKQRIENPAYYDEINQTYVTTCNPKLITETITINNHPVEFYYQHEWLSLVKGIKKDGIAVDCLNLHPSIRNSYKKEINISGSTLNANFNSGQIYLQYYSLPTNDGEIEIPEITTGDILEYIMQYVKVQIAEDLIANNKNPQGIAQLYPSWKSELPTLKRLALTESKFAGLNKNWAKNLKTLNKREFSFFNLPRT